MLDHPYFENPFVISAAVFFLLFTVVVVLLIRQGCDDEPRRHNPPQAIQMTPMNLATLAVVSSPVLDFVAALAPGQHRVVIQLEIQVSFTDY